MKQIALGMSGGVDSSTAVYLLQKNGWSVVGIHLLLTEAHDTDQNAAADAQRVAALLNIPLHVVDARDAFREHVIDPFIESHRRGATPNPCVRCNRSIKFDHLMSIAHALGCEHLATGHYARRLEKDGQSLLLRAEDPIKDQSYFLYNIKREVLPFIHFPLGGFKKEDIRAISTKLQLPVSQKKESQDICFVPDNDHVRWLSAQATDLPQHGQFVDEQGQPIGEHQGTWHYTIGQRKGLGLALGYPAYVTAIDAQRGTVTVARDDALWKTTLLMDSINWLLPDPVPTSGRALVQIRSRDHGKMASWKQEGAHVKIVFDEPVRAITPGQSAVLYDGDRVLGGGIIC